jgi:hypothetical protein
MGIERLVQYMIRCPFSFSWLLKATDSGQVVYKSEKQKCQAFPNQNGDGTQVGPNRNYQILSPLEFLAGQSLKCYSHLRAYPLVEKLHLKILIRAYLFSVNDVVTVGNEE